MSAISTLWHKRLVLLMTALATLMLWGGLFPNSDFWAVIVTNKFGMFVLLSAVAWWLRDANFTKHQGWFIGLLAAVYFIVMSRVSIARHEAFESHAFDLAIFDQAVWGVLQGQLLISSFKNGISLLGDHMSPVLFLFSPLYLIWNDVRVLLLAQALITALSFIPLTLIAQEKLEKGLAPVIFAVAFFFYQPLRHSLRSDFHPELLANLLIFWAFYALIKKREKLFLLLLGLTVLCKENMYGISFAFGLYFLFLKRWKMGFLLMALSVILFLTVTQIIMPKLAESERYFYQANYNYFFSGKWGTRPPLFAKPLECVEYLYKIFLPLGFLSFFHLPTLVLTLPILLQNLLSRNPLMHSIAFQYTSGLTPTVFISAIHGFAGLKKRKKEVLIAILFLSFAMAGKAEGQHLLKYLSLNQDRRTPVRRVIQTIQPEHSVTANENLAPHLAHRLRIYPFEDFQRKNTFDQYDFRTDLVFIDRKFTAGDTEREVKKIQNSGYRILTERDGVYLFARRELG